MQQMGMTDDPRYMHLMSVFFFCVKYVQAQSQQSPAYASLLTLLV
jgi:hypothetical protein